MRKATLYSACHRKEVQNTSTLVHAKEMAGLFCTRPECLKAMVPNSSCYILYLADCGKESGLCVEYPFVWVPVLLRPHKDTVSY